MFAYELRSVEYDFGKFYDQPEYVQLVVRINVIRVVIKGTDQLSCPIRELMFNLILDLNENYIHHAIANVRLVLG